MIDFSKFYNTRQPSGYECFKDMFKSSIGVMDYKMVKNAV